MSTWATVAYPTYTASATITITRKLYCLNPKNVGFRKE